MIKHRRTNEQKEKQKQKHKPPNLGEIQRTVGLCFLLVLLLLRSLIRAEENPSAIEREVDQLELLRVRINNSTEIMLNCGPGRDRRLQIDSSKGSHPLSLPHLPSFLNYFFPSFLPLFLLPPPSLPFPLPLPLPDFPPCPLPYATSYYDPVLPNEWCLYAEW